MHLFQYLCHYSLDSLLSLVTRSTIRVILQVTHTKKNTPFLMAQMLPYPVGMP